MEFIVFIFGVVIGSFLNVCIYRIPSGKSIAYPPSSCGSCNHRLKAKDLFPIVSYFLLRGRCRYCHQKISNRYWLVELLTGVLLTILYIKYSFSFEFIKYAILLFFLIVIALIDYDTTDVYSLVTYIGIAIALIISIFGKIFYEESISNYLIGMAIGFLVIGAIYLFLGGMGAGDIEIAMLCGGFLGWKLEIAFLLISFIIGGIVGVILILTKRKKKTDYIAFGPSLAMGAYFTILLSNFLIRRYF